MERGPKNISHPEFRQPRIILTASIILVIVTLLAGVSVFAVMQRNAEEFLDKSLQSSLHSRIELTKFEIQVGFDRTVLISTRPLMTDQLQIVDARADDTDAQNKLDKVAGSFLQNGLTAIALYGESGQELTRVGIFVQQPELAVTLNNLPGDVQLLWDGQLLLRAVVEIKREGRVIGKVMTELPLPATMGAIENASNLGKTGEQALCAPFGLKMQCFPSTLNPKVFTVSKKSPQGVPLPMTYALEGETGFITAIDYRNQEVVAAYEPVGDLGLGMVLKVDRSELYAPVWNQLRYLIPLLAGILIIALLLLRRRLTPLVEKLVRSEAEARNMALIIESSNDTIMSADLDTIITSWNAAAERMYGYTAEEIIGQSFSLVMAPESAHEMAENRSKIQDGNKIESYETLQTRKDGSTFPIFLTVSPIYDGSGVVIGSSGIARDITREKEAAQNARKLASIVESSHDAITSTSLDGVIISWNPAAERMYGYLAEEIIGQSISLIIPPSDIYETADNRSKIGDGYKIEPFETLRIRKDGSTIPIFLTLSPVYDENGLIIGVSSISRDITEQQQAKQYALDLLESAPDAMVTIDKTGTIVSVNSQTEKLFGYHRDEMLGQLMELLIPSRFHAKHAIHMGHFFADSHHRAMGSGLELFGEGKDGREFPVDISLGPIKTAKGFFVVATIRDITGEREAAQNARKLASIVESSHDAITSTSLDGVIISWNPAAERMYGYLAEEIIGQSILLVSSPENTNEVAGILSKIREGYKVEPYETLQIRKDGSTFPISLTLSPIYDESGAVIGESGIARDITKEKEAAQNARNMALIIESSNDAITSSGLEGIFTSWNPAAERMYGYLAEEMIGQSFSRLTAPENTHEDADNWSKIRDGYTVEPYETLRIRKDGSTIPISLTVSPIYDESGAVTGASAIARDITGEKEASRYARKMASLIESSNDSITSVNLEGFITSWNPAAELIYGYTAEEIIGQPASLLIPPENINELANNQSNIRGGNKIEPYETIRIRKDGSTFPLLLTLSPIYDESGAPIGTSGIARDITADKQIIRQLEEINVLRNEFVAIVAHDLRAPMASISGFAHLLVDEWNITDDGKKIEYLRIIARNTDTFAEFVEDVLQVARIEAGEFTYDIASFDIRALAQRALDEAIGSSKDQRLELITPDSLPLVLGDEERQWQVLTNLLSNALKFSPVQKPIVIELSSIEGFVQVAVIDRGIGIAEEDIAKLFRKSGRLLKSGNPIVPGNGLGLFICKTLVEAQGGRIWCESAVGEGSTFFFTIPVAP